MIINLDDPRAWPMKVPIIAHDVGRSNDRSTAVVGGNCPFTLGSRELISVRNLWSCRRACTAADWEHWQRLISATIVIV